MDSAKQLMDEDISEMIKNLGMPKISPEKAAAMIDHKQKEFDKLISCQTCLHFVRYQANKMQVKIHRLDLCCQDTNQLRPLPPGGHGCENHSIHDNENYMGEQGEASKGGIGDSDKRKEVRIGPGEALLPVPKENMTLVRVDNKTEVILKTAQGKEYIFNVADFNFDMADKRELPGHKPDNWTGDDNRKKGDLVQIVSKMLFSYKTKSRDWLVLLPQDGGAEKTISRKEFMMHFVASADNVMNQRKKVEVVK